VLECGEGKVSLSGAVAGFQSRSAAGYWILDPGAGLHHAAHSAGVVSAGCLSLFLSLARMWAGKPTAADGRAGCEPGNSAFPSFPFLSFPNCLRCAEESTAAPASLLFTFSKASLDGC